MPRSTVHDVARAAGVSLATVDRVLNRRPGVRVQTIDRVEAAAAAVDYSRDVAAANLAKRREYSLLFVVPSGANAFMRMLKREIGICKTQFLAERVSAGVVTVPPFDGDAVAAALDAAGPSVDGIAVVAADAPAVRAAIDRLARRAVPVVTLVSDIPESGRTHFCGIDNVRAGRTAAGLLGRFVENRGGTIAILAGSLVLRDHVERKQGFEEVMAAEYPDIDLLDVIEGHDDDVRCERMVSQLLAGTPGLSGLYSLGAGNPGVIAALEKSGRAEFVSVVAHELGGATRRALESGTIDAVINQDAGHEVRSAVRVLKARLDDLPVNPDQERIRIDVFLRDNMPGPATAQSR